MITFEQHIEISKHIGKTQNFAEYIESLEPHKRIGFMRDVSIVYPLDDKTNINQKTLDKFNCHIKVNDLVLGQFIMIEQIITGKMNFDNQSKNDLELAKLIMRPKHHEIFDNDDEETEIQNEINILNTDVRQVYAVLQSFLNDREFVLFKQFKGVFYELPDDDDVEDEKEEKSSEALFQQKWYLYTMLRMLAKEDITKYDEIYMLKMRVVMPEMSFIAQRSKIDQANQRRQQAIRKL